MFQAGSRHGELQSFLVAGQGSESVDEAAGERVAATYTIKGPTKDPSVMVNPLSVLTPGILRSIFFENNKE